MDNPSRSHDTASFSSERFSMTTLYAKGLVKGDGLVAYLWGHGHYKYEIESIVAGKGRLTLCEVFEASYEEAMEKFKGTVDKVVML